jgi:hypothetical protein
MKWGAGSSGGGDTRCHPRNLTFLIIQCMPIIIIITRMAETQLGRRYATLVRGGLGHGRRMRHTPMGVPRLGTRAKRASGPTISWMCMRS